MFQEFFTTFFNYLTEFDSLIWGRLAVPAILIFGAYLSFKAQWMQFFQLKKITKMFYQFLEKPAETSARGVNPIRTFFASIAGCIGIGNVVGVCTAVQIGGPGAIFWLWVASILGVIVKYSEIYLGIKYRVKNEQDSYDGGPMYYLKAVDPSGFLSKIFCVVLCIYGVEIYMFRIITHTVVEHWGFDRNLVIAALLIAILLAAYKGVSSVGRVTSIVIPCFVVCFASVSFWVFFKNIDRLPAIFSLIIRSAFTGHAAVGAFAGSSVFLAMSQGMKRACYVGDIGVGYASVMMAETDDDIIPERQAALGGIFGVFFDIFVICTTSLLLIIVSGLWNQGIHESHIVAVALAQYIPHVNILWPLFIFLLGFSSATAFFASGKKAAKFLWQKHGSTVYTLYAIFAFLTFSFVGSEAHIMTIMSASGACLLILNMYGIFKLRNELSFNLDGKKD